MEKPKNKSVIDLDPYINTTIRVKFTGGREVVGTLLSWDKLCNLVLDKCVEFLPLKEDPSTLSENTRKIGLTVARGQAVQLICPEEGTTSIANPWAQEAKI